jgi:hypothetical protein
MNQIYAYLFIFSVLLSAIVPMIAYIRNKYYYIDITPIHYWLNKKTKIKKRYKTLRKYKAKKRNSYSAVINKYKLTSNK